MAVSGIDLSHLVDYKKAFDPSNINQREDKSAKRSQLRILDEIYKTNEEKIVAGIERQRSESYGLRKPKKTWMMERMELIEARIKRNHEIQ